MPRKKIVEHHRRFATFQKGAHIVGTDIPGTAANQNCHELLTCPLRFALANNNSALDVRVWQEAQCFVCQRFNLSVGHGEEPHDERKKARWPQGRHDTDLRHSGPI